MKKWYYIVLGGILIVGCIYIYLHRVDLGLVGPAPGGSQQPARIAWVSVDRTPEGFKLDMPSDTREIELPAYNERGGADQVDMIYSYPDPETSYSIAWADNPPVERASAESPQQTLDEAEQGALARTETQLQSESRSTLQGFPVRDFVGRNDGGGIFNARLVLNGQRLYMLMVAFPAESARRDADVTRFFDSFQMAATGENQ